MKKTLNHLFLFALLIPSQAYATRNVGNGGDTVTCTKSVDNPYHGTYFLDYILAAENSADQLVAVGATNTAIRLAQITKKLKRIVPEFGWYLETFYEAFKNYRTGKQTRLDHFYWRNSAHGLVDIKDENLIERLPKNCYREMNGTIQIEQLIIRKVRAEDQHVFQLNVPLFATLDATKTEQTSWIMVHEMAWDFTENTEHIRELNEYVHTDLFLDDNDEVARKYIAILLGNYGYSAQFNRPQWIKDSIAPLQEQLEKSYDIDSFNLVWNTLQREPEFFDIPKNCWNIKPLRKAFDALKALYRDNKDDYAKAQKQQTDAAYNESIKRFIENILREAQAISIKIDDIVAEL